MDKESEEFQIWYEGHKNKCFGNYDGTSGSMEVVIAKDIWSRSLEFGFRYKYMVGDGDSRSYNAIWDIYGCCADSDHYERLDQAQLEIPPK